MYINVKLLNGFKRELTYKVPDEWDQKTLTGAIVKVPLQKRTELAVVTDCIEKLESVPTFTIRPAICIEKLPSDQFYGPFITRLSDHYCLEPMIFYQRMRSFLTTEKAEENHLYDSYASIATTELPILTYEQQRASDAICTALSSAVYQSFLLHGVTGSGKTEVYKKAIQQAISQNKIVLFLVPEVSLAIQFTHIFRKSLPDIACFGFHSATGAAEKKELWSRLLQQQASLIIGVHLPLLLPLPNLGLILVDEEHDPGFQEKKHPKINSKEMALLRAHISKIPIVLGSATPSLASLYQVHNKKCQLLTLTKRFAGAFPTVKLVPLISEKKRPHFWISPELEQALKERLAKKEQSIIFINRRGFSFFVQCSSCALVFECPSCSVSLTLHEDNSLRCHYCAYSRLLPERCPCTPGKPTLLKRGIGTQQMMTILQKIVPKARIERADLDSTINKKRWQQTINDFHNGTIDILVGTQTITKGYHFPNVTLVGVIWADLNLNIPFYTATENMLQQLIQVAGRAGRQSPESLVIVQSMMKHPLYAYLNESNYTEFYQYELTHRAELSYPPCVRFAEIELRYDDEKILDTKSINLVNILLDFNNKNGQILTILGPTKPLVHKVKNVFSRKIYLKSKNYNSIQAAYRLLKENEGEIKVFFTPNPLQ